MAGKKMASKPIKYGEWAFLIGVLLALFIGLFSGWLGQAENAGLQIYLMGVLVFLGFVVGFMNVPDKEVTGFLIAAIALMAVSTSWGPITEMLGEAVGIVADPGVIETISDWIDGFLGALTAFVTPAALIVALKQIYDLASK